ncbi:MAG TPA: alpha/beta fold hydrolase [Phnomibacter sp.]|nr:alpha/beta fold hydrolase [Phnomibacter sp.]
MKKIGLLMAWLAYCLAPEPLDAQPCDDQYRPLVLVHGFLGAGDNFSPLLQHLYNVGYCPQRCFVYDWNTMERVDQSPALDRFIDSVLQLTGAEKVDLAGHSAGGGVSGAYLANAERMKKVERYVHMGSTLLKGPAGVDGSIPTLNLYSTGDRVIQGGDIPGATNVRYTSFDHFEIVTTEEVAKAMFGFFNPGKRYEPRKLVPVPNTFAASGKVLALGQNTPQAGAKIEVMPLDMMGIPGAVVATGVSDAEGRFSLSGLAPYQPYWVLCHPPAGRSMAYYFPRIAPNDDLLYLRTLPAQGMISMLLGAIPNDTLQAALVLFSNQRAIVHGRDELEVQGVTLSTPEFADAARTGVAWFLFDGNSNGRTDTTLMQPLSNFPFLRAVDLRLAAGDGPATVRFNGNTYRVPLVPSRRAITIVVLQP